MKCPPGYKYNPKTKTCEPKKSNRVMRFRNYAFFGRPSKNGNGKNGNGNGNGNGGNGSGGNGGNGSGGNGGGNGGGGNGGGGQ